MAAVPVPAPTSREELSEREQELAKYFSAETLLKINGNCASMKRMNPALAAQMEKNPAFREELAKIEAEKAARFIAENYQDFDVILNDLRRKGRLAGKYERLTGAQLASIIEYHIAAIIDQPLVKDALTRELGGRGVTGWYAGIREYNRLHAKYDTRVEAYEVGEILEAVGEASGKAGLAALAGAGLLALPPAGAVVGLAALISFFVYGCGQAPEHTVKGEAPPVPQPPAPTPTPVEQSTVFTFKAPEEGAIGGFHEDSPLLNKQCMKIDSSMWAKLGKGEILWLQGTTRKDEEGNFQCAAPNAAYQNVFAAPVELNAGDSLRLLGEDWTVESNDENGLRLKHASKPYAILLKDGEAVRVYGRSGNEVVSPDWIASIAVFEGKITSITLVNESANNTLVRMAANEAFDIIAFAPSFDFMLAGPSGEGKVKYEAHKLELEVEEAVQPPVGTDTTFQFDVPAGAFAAAVSHAEWPGLAEGEEITVEGTADSATKTATVKAVSYTKDLSASPVGVFGTLSLFSSPPGAYLFESRGSRTIDEVYYETVNFMDEQGNYLELPVSGGPVTINGVTSPAWQSQVTLNEAGAITKIELYSSTAAVLEIGGTSLNMPDNFPKYSLANADFLLGEGTGLAGGTVRLQLSKLP